MGHGDNTIQSTNQFFLNVPRFSAEYGKRSFSALAPTVWNILPLNIRLSTPSNAVWKLTFSNSSSTPLPCMLPTWWLPVPLIQYRYWTCARYKCMYNKNIETVSGPCNTCFWYARAPAVRHTSRGGDTYCMGQRPFLFLLLIYQRFLMIFYAKFQRYFTQKHGIADVVWT